MNDDDVNRNVEKDVEIIQDFLNITLTSSQHQNDWQAFDDPTVQIQQRPVSIRLHSGQTLKCSENVQRRTQTSSFRTFEHTGDEALIFSKFFTQVPRWQTHSVSMLRKFHSRKPSGQTRALFVIQRYDKLYENLCGTSKFQKMNLLSIS